MKRTTLARYLISEILPVFLFGLLAFTSILLVARVLKLIELVVNRGVSLTQIGTLFAYIFPTFLELTVPMAFLLSVLVGLGRLAADHEILALKASGVSPAQIFWPVAWLGLLIAVITLLLTTLARPTANAALKKELYNIAKSRVGTALKEKVFNDDFPHILIYVEEVIPPGNTAQGILIVDKRDKLKDSVILGKVALITTDESSNTFGLKLFDGSIYERDKKRAGFSQTRFNIYDFKLDLDELVGPVQKKDAGPKEMSLGELLGAIREKREAGSQAIAERMELHQRFSFAFVPLIFALLGVSLTLLPRSWRTSRSWGFTLSLFWLLLYYGLLSLGKAFGEKGLVHPAVSLWFPNFVVSLIALHLFYKALRESPLFLPARVEDGWSAVVYRLARMAGRS
ncbi:MAG TPA: LPS export ABC transporter permease LptF [candidate division Zixibacteria bacterium]|nr:LPS export ABC transporter permease LptF [candidate division Zixibacteria bacterium]